MTSNASPATARQGGRGSGPGRPKDLGKRAAILEAAKRMFIEQGYNGVSMDTIAAEAGVSKLTVYSHFGDKETLFTAAVQSKCTEMMPDELFVTDVNAPLRDQLVGIALAFFNLVNSEAALSVQRVMMAPETDDRLREMFWQAGPKRTTDALAEFLGARTARGELEIEDVELAAIQFMTLVKGELHMNMMCGCQPPTPQDTHSHLAASVDFFLRAYAPR